MFQSSLSTIDIENIEKPQCLCFQPKRANNCRGKAVSVDLKFQPIQQQIPFGGGGGQAFCSEWAAGRGFVGGRCMVGWVGWMVLCDLPFPWLQTIRWSPL